MDLPEFKMFSHVNSPKVKKLLDFSKTQTVSVANDLLASGNPEFMDGLSRQRRIDHLSKLSAQQQNVKQLLSLYPDQMKSSY
jgi:hypothetical protein